MFRRAFLGIAPAILALAFWFGAPGASGGAPEPTASPWKADAAWSLVARGNSAQDTSDSPISQSADQDDSPDDRVIRTVTTITWPAIACYVRTGANSHLVGPTHRACAAPPRAPPSV